MSRGALLQQVLQGDIEITPAFPENFTLLDCPFPKEVPFDYCRSKYTFIANPEVVRACETGQFGNEFVVFSLLESPRTYTQCICETKVFPNKPLPFSLLLDPSSRNRIEKTVPITVSSIPASQCSVNEWPSMNGDCHPLLCGPGKEFLDGKCTVKVEEIKGLSYRLRLWLQPIPSDSLGLAGIFAKKTFNLMILKIQEMVEEFSNNYRLDVGGLVDTNSIPFFKFPAIFWMECLLFAHQNITQNDLDVLILNHFMSGNISVQNFENAKLIVKPIQMLPQFVVENSVAQNIINQSQTVYLHAEYKSESFITGLKVDYIKVNHVLICRFVRFEPEQYQTDVRDDVIPPDITLTIDLNGTKIRITDTADLNMVDIGQDGELNVCEDLLNSKLKMFKDDVLEGNRELAGTSLAEYIVSIACSLASILCLVLTLMTYVLFSELRTEAGLNNMFLSSSLLLAQVCLVITSHIFRSSTMCTVLGVVTHFMWLWMFSWSFLCSYHMFQVFTSNTSRTSSQPDVIIVWKKILFSLTCPSVIILTTIVGSYLASAGKEIGYGRFSCFLNSTLLVGLTLVWPLSLVTLTNVVLFTVAVNKSHSVRKLQTIFKKNERDNESHIYAMISSVTLAFWTVNIVAAALGNDFLRLISIVLNGLQGVAIFMSFICNKRVLLLYQQMRCFKREAKTEEIRVEPIHSN
ncbi:adhesion G protein-coupled receptor E4P [Biomphalaria glabrata]|nr:adhesion G protein-coupled receptor E4P [Biomphalaria glabrata]